MECYLPIIEEDTESLFSSVCEPVLAGMFEVLEATIRGVYSLSK